MSFTETLSRLESLEASLLSVIETVRSLRVEIQKQANGNPSLEPLLDVEELAKILGLDVDYIYRQAQAGKIPSKKIGKYRKFQPSKIQSWLEKKNS
jgi:excisionase family DNA binding protein